MKTQISILLALAFGSCAVQSVITLNENSTVIGDSFFYPCGHPTWVTQYKRDFYIWRRDMAPPLVGGSAWCSDDCKTCYYYQPHDTSGGDPMRCEFIEGQGYPGSNGDCPVKICGSDSNAGWCRGGTEVHHCRVERDV